ncbi:tartrate dehydrogenase [Sphaerobacter thermophilus]|uniref:D-malate dehydrogenase (decarboxylating) n=1 Tax=Sphaerobacter thermophilus (strain ATCC 49802 / DSM 20745 / KCCM 41009 / NCIMB 13125 / S 6022) TaxID=479434 RepID=D1CAS5_SPHTD|nr:tartrate dehydrogenase [Sphaerobacter thermophilus]ACZ40918.1 tartrate dehydrogenase [Sphaerobacter thermophilus DSM 20745]
MQRYRIAVIAGDGIGREVIPAGKAVLEAAVAGSAELVWTDLPWGSDYYRETGAMMPADGIETLKGFDAIYLGAVGDPPHIPDHVTLWGLMLPIRKALDMHVNVRPIRLLPGITGPLRDKGPADIDMIFVRENTEGEYAGVGGRIHVGTPYEVALQTAVFSRFNVERVVRYAFELARTRRRHLTSVTKSNAQQYSMVFWDEVVAAVAADYPDVEVQSLLVDAAAALMVRAPERFDVVVASNLFADILTDLGGALMGSLGLAPSANLTADPALPSLFEPIHGSAPDIAGRGVANPLGAIWAGAMMLEHLGEADAAARVMRAIEATTAEGTTLTPDLGGTASTDQVAERVIAHLSAS